ncbi:hypothetical protein Mgra_00001782 [Meloidogyne graminicola]|uniref:Uncharacterized protein n=1 Tax=Meloidogyne graminicola TaxID=189291 RepID=A0A8S9ZZJ8_9BILA|nr:hypothetical protein Mgra_00001782 [Meloidogyne graminicola]
MATSMNGKSDGNNDVNSIKSEQIMKQVEYYFGDINLPRDKFIQEEMKKDNGWIPLSTMLKFNRLAALTKDIDNIAASLKNSHLIDISDDNLKIRRNPEVPMPENTLEYWQEIKRRTVYLKGFPLETTLDEISEFVNKFGIVENVLMRKTKVGKETPRMFKGSVFATFKDKDDAKRLADITDLKFKDEFVLINKMQDTYWADKHAERVKQKDLKKQMKKTQIEQQNKAHFKKGVVLKISGLKTDELNHVTLISKLKTFFEPFGKPAFVNIDGNEATIRFFSVEEDAADGAWQKAVNSAKENGDSEGKVMFEGNEIKGAVLDGEEEEKYWADFSKAKLAKRDFVEKQQKGKKQFDRNSSKAGRKRRADKGRGHVTDVKGKVYLKNKDLI